MSKTYSKVEVAKMAADWWAQLLVIYEYDARWLDRKYGYDWDWDLLPPLITNEQIKYFKEVLELEIIVSINSSGIPWDCEHVGFWQGVRLVSNMDVNPGKVLGEVNKRFSTKYDVNFLFRRLPFAYISLSPNGMIINGGRSEW